MSEQLSNPPLYYVLAEVRFPPVLLMANFVPQVQEKFRKLGLEEYETKLFPTPSITPPIVFTPGPAWLFTNRERNLGFNLTTQSFFIHTTDYSTHEALFEKFVIGIQFLREIVGISILKRLGLRYLDAIVLQPGEEFSKYLSSGLVGLNLNENPIGAATEAIYSTNLSFTPTKGNLIARSFLADSKIGFPSDLSPDSLKVNQKFIFETNVRHAILDTDHYVEAELPFANDPIISNLVELHQAISRVFVASCTDEARKGWK